VHQCEVRGARDQEAGKPGVIVEPAQPGNGQPSPERTTFRDLLLKNRAGQHQFQNEYRRPNWICRADVALVTFPNADEVKVAFGLLKFTWFGML
jgi:hypothetical protein